MHWVLTCPPDHQASTSHSLHKIVHLLGGAFVVVILGVGLHVEKQIVGSPVLYWDFLPVIAELLLFY